MHPFAYFTTRRSSQDVVARLERSERFIFHSRFMPSAADMTSMLTTAEGEASVTLRHE